MFDSLLVQHPVEAPVFGRSISQTFLPDFLVFHAKIDKHAGRMGANTGDDFLIDLNPQWFKISHFPIEACDKFSVDDVGFRKAFLNKRFECRQKAKCAQADSDNSVR